MGSFTPEEGDLEKTFMSLLFGWTLSVVIVTAGVTYLICRYLG